MTEADVIATLTDDGFEATPRLQALWQASAATQAMQPAMLIADRMGTPTPLFAGLCRRAMSKFLPLQPIVVRAGTPTLDMLNWWNSVA